MRWSRIAATTLTWLLVGCGSDSGGGNFAGTPNTGGVLSNGAACSGDWECQSGDCSPSVGGAKYCYGKAALGTSCTVTQDCFGGICRQAVCVATDTCKSNGDCPVNADCKGGSCIKVCGTNAYVASSSECACLPGFQWASDDPNDTNCVASPAQPGCHIYAQDPGSTYLGEVGGCYGVNSVCNEYGSYGSSYAASSIFNEYGSFGSAYGTYSAFNVYATSPPQLVCNGVGSGCVTVNSYAVCTGGPNRDPKFLCNCP